MQMVRFGVVAGALAMGVLAGVRCGWAMDPQLAGGAGGIGVRPSVVSTGTGRNGDDGLARPGIAVADFRGGIGLRTANVTAGTNVSTEASYHASGMGKSINGGVGYSTMGTVPGRTPVYINIVVGKRMEPMVGNIGM